MAKTTHSLRLMLAYIFHLTISVSATCTFPSLPDSSPSPPPHDVKGMFVFGSSYVDNGDNFFLRNCLAKYNYLPYGIDFPLGNTGRSTNGKNVIDFLGEELELPPYLPVFTNPDTKGKKVVNGVNFASGASGILDDTGSMMGVISLNQQLKNFEEVTLKELEKQVGCRSSESLPNYLFVLGVGGNDYTGNYFKATTSNVTLEDFTVNLTNILTLHIQKLYDLGARKFVLMSMYPIGCSPSIMAAHPDNKGCVEVYNRAARCFNTQLRLLVDKMKLYMPGSNPVYVNAYEVILNIIQNPASKGFRDVTTSCCGPFEGSDRCESGGSVCANRDTHGFFDGIHPTEAVNKLIVKSVFSSNLTTRVYPINIKQLSSS